jgi:mycothiol synthase
VAGRGIGTGLLRWMEQRTRQRFAADACSGSPAGAAPRLRLHTEEQHAHQAALLEDSGYRIVRYSSEMHRPLDIRPPRPLDEEGWAFVVNDPRARPDLSAVVLEQATGTVAGYQLASHDADSAGTRGFREGYTDLLGVRRELRGRGIAQALLAEAVRRFAAAAMDRASLDAESENPTGALALYPKMGYTAVSRSMAWDKDL